jgi:hypothetical protein
MSTSATLSLAVRLICKLDCSIPQELLLISVMKCDSSQDGGWALVRRIGQGSQWFAGTDKLTGMNNWYDPSNGDFCTPYSHLLNPQTEFMFATGKR